MPSVLPTALFVAAAGCVAAAASAQTPAASSVPARAAAGQAAAAAPQPAAPASPTPAQPPENYSYEPDGRRDPFLNLLGQGNESSGGTTRRADGAEGLTVAEISVKGVLKSGGALLAMIQGPDNKTYIVRQGDKFADGAIRAVTAEGLVIVQEVNDPLSLVKQREVHKTLRSQEGGKE
jgi:type IV pilus assembly protein PilP